jgi:hypothetical protein
VSRLEQRLSRLEGTLGCGPDCKPTVELVYGTKRSTLPPSGYCKTCSQPRERITVLLAFDPDEREP